MAHPDEPDLARDDDARLAAPERSELFLMAEEVGLPGGFSLEWLVDRIGRSEARE